MKKKYPLFAIVVVVLLVVIFSGYYYFNDNLIPKVSEFPLFPDEYSTMPNSRWKTNYIQPYYLGSYEDEKGRLTLRTAYRNSRGQIRKMNVVVSNIGREEDKGDASFFEKVSNTKTADLGSVVPYIKKLNVGSQIKIGYPSPLNSSVQNDNTICTAIKGYCAIGEFSENYSQGISLLNSKSELTLTKDFLLPAFSVSLDLTK